MHKLRLSGKKLKFKSIEDILRLGNVCQLAFISAVNPQNADNTELRLSKTRELEGKIASGYNYYTNFGGWVEYPENSETGEEDKTKPGIETTEESFIVVGKPHSDSEYQKNLFRQHMCKLASDFDQWAVMIVDGVEKIEEVTYKQLKDRYDAYAVFSDPKFIEEAYREEIRESYGDETEKAFECITQKILPFSIYRAEANYFSPSGKKLKHYENISTVQVADFFTTLNRDSKAHKFTFIADNVRYIQKFTPHNVFEGKMLPYNKRIHHISENRKTLAYKHTECINKVRNAIISFIVSKFI